MKGLKLVIGLVVTSLTVAIHPAKEVYAEETTGEVVANETVTHTHYGEEAVEGGCYTVPNYTNYGTTTKTENKTCGAPTTVTAWNTAVCTQGHTNINTCCAHAKSPQTCSTCNGSTTNAGYNIFKNGTCTISAGTQSYTVCNNCGSRSCNGNHIVGYSLNCGLEEGDVEAIATMYKSVSSDGYMLNVEVDTDFPVSYTWQLGPDKISYESTCKVTANDTYWCHVAYEINGEKHSRIHLRYDVSDFDDTAPVIKGFGQSVYIEGLTDSMVYVPNKQDYYTKENIRLQINAIDEGVGICEYSLDGTTWQTENYFLITENGDYTAYVRDFLGNTTSASVSPPITVIDRTPPLFTYSLSENEWTKGPVTITYSGEDEISGTGIYFKIDGLFDYAKWTTSANSYEITRNGTYTIYAKDDVGNATSKTFVVNNIDNKAPVITINSYDTAWTNSGVAVTYSATDNSGDTILYAVSDKDNLTAASITSSETSTTITANGTYYVYAVDLAGNVSKKAFTVDNIDTEGPKISITSNNVYSPWDAITNTGIHKTTIVSTSGIVNEVTITCPTENAFYAYCYVPRYEQYRLYASYFGKSLNLVLPSDVTATLSTGGSISGGHNFYVNSTESYESDLMFFDSVNAMREYIEEYVIQDTTVSWTNEDVTVTYSAVDNSGGTVYYAVSDKDDLTATDVTGSATPYTVTKNGVYYIYAKDEAGNLTKKIFVVNNIDKIAPTIFLPGKFPAINSSFSITGVRSFCIEDDSDSWDDIYYNDFYYTEIDRDASNAFYALVKTGEIKGQPSYQLYRFKEGASGPYECIVSYTEFSISQGSINSGTKLVSYNEASQNNLECGLMYFDSEADMKKYVYARLDTDAYTQWTNKPITLNYPAVDNVSDTIYYTVSDKDNLTANDITGMDPFCTITENGIYYLYAVDEAGNLSKESFNITNIDTEAPVITIDDYDKKWNKNITITFSATDNSDSLIYYKVSKYDNLTAEDITRDKTYYSITANGTYYIYAKDEAGNITTEEIIISNIDRETPVISVNEYNTEWTNKDITITFTVTDNSEDIIYSTVSRTSMSEYNIRKITSTISEYKITRNGLYYIYAIDVAGNWSVQTIDVKNIDKDMPVGTISSQPKNEVIVDGVTWTDEIFVTLTGFDFNGLAEKPYSEDGENFTTENLFVYNNNGTKKLYLKDRAGNIGTLIFEISSIDATAPIVKEITYSYTDLEGNVVETKDQSEIPATSSINLAFSITDSESGLHDLPFRYKTDNENWSEWSNECKITGIVKNAVYSVEFRDALGNTASTMVNIDSINEEGPVIYLDVDETGKELGQITRYVKIGEVVVGSDIGNDTRTGAYYTGYDYVSCDTAIVETTGTTVHRYFKLHECSVIYHNANGSIFTEDKVSFGSYVNNLASGPVKSSIEDSYYVIDYEFIGWADGNGNIVDATSIGSIEKDIALYPTYKEIKTEKNYTVTFYVDGREVNTQTVTAGSAATAPATPDKEGYVFDKWDKSFAHVTSNLSVNAIFISNTYTITNNNNNNNNNIVVGESKPTITIPSEEDLVKLSNTEVTYIDTSLAEKQEIKKEENTGIDEDALSDLLDVKIEKTPLSTFTDAITNFYTDSSTRTIAVTTTTAIGIVTSYSLVSFLLSAMGGFSLTQLLIFGFVLFKKKIRYVKGAWLTDTEGIKYVDKYGRKVTVIRENGRTVFKRKGKILHAIDVSLLLEKLNSNQITYKEFEEIIAGSEVCTVFSKDVEIETWNVKSQHNKTTSKMSGFNMTRNIKKAFDSSGRYAIRLTQNGRQAMFEVKYAMQNA